MSIFKKLILGFLSISILVLAAGVIGILSMNRIANELDRLIVDELPLKDLSMEASLAALSVQDSSGEYQLNSDGLDEIGKELSGYLAELKAWLAILRYGSDNPVFLQSEAGRTYRESNMNISSRGVPSDLMPIAEQSLGLANRLSDSVGVLMETHDDRVSYNFSYNGKNWDIDNFLTLVELQHKDWIDTLYTDATADQEFSGEPDPTKCFFGKWYYSYRVADPVLLEKLDQFEDVHNLLHSQAAVINSASGRAAKVALYDARVIPVKQDIEEHFRSIESYVSPTINGLRNQETQAMEDLDTVSTELRGVLGGLEGQIDVLVETAKNRANEVRKGSIFLLVVTVTVSIVLALGTGLIIAMGISRPLGKVTDLSEAIAQGDLGAELPDIRSKDEVGTLARSFGRMADALRKKSEVLKLMAAKDLTADIPMASERDELGISLIEMKKSLNSVLSEATASAHQVQSASDQVAQSSQALSQGATEQASSMEEISATVTQINAQARDNASQSDDANALARQASESASEGNGLMEQLSGAMGRISESSGEIRKVVKVIDDIAFQINLLALNANVEAARAGKYGKGFAVVAEEVRNLASRSGEAVKQTTVMVDEVTRLIEEGNGTATSTADALKSIVEASGSVAEVLDRISKASSEQARGIEQISTGLDQIDQVTQANTASAEESAAASEELAGQARELLSLIAEFSLEGSGVMPKAARTTSFTPLPPPAATVVLDDDDFGNF